MGRRACASAVIAIVALGISIGTSTAGAKQVTKTTYDTFQKPGGYTLSDYLQKWNNGFGPGEMAVSDTRNFTGGSFNVSATPFRTGADFSVFDHLKYIALSNQSFGVPTRGSVTFESDIRAATPGTVANLTQRGVYGPSGAWTDPMNPPDLQPYRAKVLEGQQAGVVMNVVDFCTGQLFDWFVTSNTAFPLIERLPSNVTGNTSNPGCPGATTVGRSKMYTQIIKEIPVRPDVTHHVSITYKRKANDGVAVYELDGRTVAKVKHVGVPLDRQGRNYTGTYPSLGPGEPLYNQIQSLTIGHGLFSLIDAFPFQHPEAPELSVSIPVGTSSPADAGRARLFGQGARGSFDNFEVTTETKGHNDADDVDNDE
jgi:hypothetical protein